jgi:osmotically-inducible protein OsmY
MKKLIVLGMLTTLVTAADAYTNRYEGSSSANSSSYNTRGTTNSSSNTNLNPYTGPEMLKQNNFSANFNNKNAHAGDRIASRQDQQLLQRIRSELNSQFGPSTTETITLELNNGRVTIFGTVDTTNNSRSIEDTITGISGVKGVSNQLTVNEVDEMMRTAPTNTFGTNRSAGNAPFANQIRQTLSSSAYGDSLDTVNVTVNGGIVTLTGIVPNRNVKAMLERTVYGIDGVTQVNNYLTVDSRMNRSSGTASSQAFANRGSGMNDSQLAKAINAELKSGWFTSGYKNVTISVTDGIVTLSGTVPSNNLKTKAEQTAKGFDGVQSVVNNLRIAN